MKSCARVHYGPCALSVSGAGFACYWRAHATIKAWRERESILKISERRPMSESQETQLEEMEVTEPERKRRRLRPNEVAMLREYIKFADPGIAIAFGDLPNVNMKRALFPSSQLRLVEKELLRPTYNEESGLLETVTIDPDMLNAYKWDLEAPEPKFVARPPRDPDEQRRRPRNILMDPKFKIHIKSDVNPRRIGTHAWYNWEHCYLNDLTIPEYLSRMDYPREIKVQSRSGESWFNGPSTVYLYQDFKASNIGIYDSTKEESDAEYWLKPDAIEKEDLESADSNNESENIESQGEFAGTPAG